MSQAYKLQLSNRVAEETQLQAEEKWILEALSKVKAQRNCLQIERLQLESMKAQLRNSSSTNIAEAAKKVTPASATPTITTFSISMAAPKPASETTTTILSTPNRKLLEAEAQCNTETLQLGVENNFFSVNPAQQFSMEEYEEEEENDDDLLLDMNMFMNCAQKQQQ